MWMPVFYAVLERLAGNLLSEDGSQTQLPTILLVILLDVDARLNQLNTSWFENMSEIHFREVRFLCFFILAKAFKNSKLELFNKLAFSRLPKNPFAR